MGWDEYLIVGLALPSYVLCVVMYVRVYVWVLIQSQSQKSFTASQCRRQGRFERNAFE